MRPVNFKRTGICVSILLTATALLILQLSGVGRLTATNSNEPMTEAASLSSCVIAEHPPVELIERRDDHTRVYEIARDIERRHPDGSVTVDVVKTYIHEKASGLCYRDASGAYVPSVAEWRETPDGFIIDRCPYRLAMGKSIDTAARCTVEGNDFLLRPAHLIISDGVNQAHLATLDPETPGSILPDNPSVLRFPSAFGEGYDLEYVGEKGGFHQNLIIGNPPQVPKGFDPHNTAVHLYTEINLDSYLVASRCEVTVEGERVNTSATDLLSPASRGGSISFHRAGRLLHAFCVSQVSDCSGPGALDKETIAEKRLLKDPSTAIAYLVESVPLSYFTDRAAAYPVTWDYWSIQEPISGGTWEPRHTYWVTDNIYIQGTLTILPGTTIKLNPAKTINIVGGGKLTAKGEPYNYITFTKASDTDCGEPISGAPAGGWEKVFSIWSGSSAQSMIEYCKFGHGNTAIYLARTLLDGAQVRPIQHNVFQDTLCAMYVDGCSATGHNNLMTYCSYFGIYVYDGGTVVFTNNTIDHTSEFAGIFDFGSSSFTATDNLFSNCGTGIRTDSPSAYLDYNGYWRCGTAVSGAQRGPNSIELGYDANPYDQCTLGTFFLNTDSPGGADLRDAGSTTAAEAGLYDHWKSVNVPVEDIPEEITVETEGWELWKRVFIDAGKVDIGYHHCRVDYVLTHNVTLTGTSLEAAWCVFPPGLVLAFAPPSDDAPVELVAGYRGQIRCKGDRVSGAVCRLISDKAASMRIESPWWLNDLSGKVRLSAHSHPGVPNLNENYDWPGSYARDCWFSGGVTLDVELALYESARFLSGNVFQLSPYGLRCTATNTFSNCVFFANLDGVTAWDSSSGGELDGELALRNCTFADNVRGIYVGGQQGGQAELTAADCVFSEREVASTCAIVIPDSTCVLNEHHNAFYKPDAGVEDHIWVDGSPASINIPGGSINLSERPYDPGADYCRCFLLSQSSPPVDAGSRTAVEAEMNVGTTSDSGGLDAGVVDMGYHYRVLAPTTAPGPDNVLVLYNSNEVDFGESKEIADYYCEKRGIPVGNKVPILLQRHHFIPPYDDPEDDRNNPEEPGYDAGEYKKMWLSKYFDEIRPVVDNWFEQHHDNEIRFIVVCKGLPYQIWDDKYTSITYRLTLWKHDHSTKPLANVGISHSPEADARGGDYNEGDTTFRGAGVNRRFGPNTYSVWDYGRGYGLMEIPCLATVLNGFAVGDVKKMIDKSVESRLPRDDVHWVLDSVPGADTKYNMYKQVGMREDRWWTDRTSYRIKSADIGDGPLMGYSFWSSGYFQLGSHGHHRWRRTHLDFSTAKGAVETHWESHSGRAFHDEADAYGQGLLADGLHPEACGGSGYSRSFCGGNCHVWEPGASAPSSPVVFFPRYYEGYTFAEAIYMGYGGLGAHSMPVGDPLMTVE